MGDSFALKLNVSRQIEEPNYSEQYLKHSHEETYAYQKFLHKYDRIDGPPPEEEEEAAEEGAEESAEEAAEEGTEQSTEETEKESTGETTEGKSDITEPETPIEPSDPSESPLQEKVEDESEHLQVSQRTKVGRITSNIEKGEIPDIREAGSDHRDHVASQFDNKN